MKYFLIASIFLVSFQSLAKIDIEKRRTQILNIIDEELDEVKRLARQGGNLDPDLVLRRAELNLEKARLYREKENQSYLKLPVKKRIKVNKKRYFSTSSKYFSKANDLCVSITRKYKNYARLGDVYYILGYNAKEANQSKKATKYLKLAGKKTSDGQTKVKTQISLAEIYYNKKKYSKAIPLYEKALLTHKDRWWTKDSFNLAWCYFRTNRKTKAISKMKEVFKASAKPKFVDMRAQVERDIGYLFATSNKITEGIKFYQKIGINFTDQLLRIAVSLIEQGKYTRAETVLAHASKHEKDKYKLVEINIEKLGLYEKHGKYSMHHKVVNNLFSDFKQNNLTKNQLASFVFQLEKISALLQRQVVGKAYRRLKKQRKAKARQAIAYFSVLAAVDKKRTEEFHFLKGETAFAAAMYTEAFTYYKQTFAISEKIKKPKFKLKSMDGMLSSVSRLKKSTDKNIYVFEAYINNWPKSKRSKGIYNRLFNSYMSTKNYPKAKSVIQRFSLSHPKDINQEAMIAKLMDARRAQKNNKAIRLWVLDIEAGKYFVSAKYKKKLQELLTAMQIEDVQDNLAKGNKKVALVGYLDILDDPYSTKRSKVNAKYNLAALYYELGDADNANKWALASMLEMNPKDVVKFSSSFITIANFLFTSLEFNASAQLFEKYVLRTCSIKSKKKNSSFKNSAFIYLAEGNTQATEKLLSQAKKCKIPKQYLQEIEYELMREYYTVKDWKQYEFYVLKNINSPTYYSKTIDDLLNLVNIHSKFNNLDKEKRFRTLVRKLYYKAKKQKHLISLRVLDYFAQLNIFKMEKTAKSIRGSALAFPEKKFQKGVESKIKLLDLLVEQGNDVMEVGSGVGIVNSYKILYDTYLYVGRELGAFTPTDKSKEYVVGFKKQFSAISKQMIKGADRYRAEAVKAIGKNSILNQNNFHFQPQKFPVKFYGGQGVVIMDRSGK